jgi:hypothetical protein
MSEAILDDIRSKVNAGSYDDALAAIASANLDGSSYHIEFELLVEKLRCYLAKTDVVGAKAAADAIITAPVSQLRLIATRYRISPFIDAMLNYIIMIGQSVGYTSTVLDPYKAFITGCGDLDGSEANIALFRAYNTLWLNEADYFSTVPTNRYFLQLLQVLEPSERAKLPPGHDELVKSLATIAKHACYDKDAATIARVETLTAGLI